jgi:2-amino-4-hydroxy-6-hydroxymethyldihydropteridine diphosphokinase
MQTGIALGSNQGDRLAHLQSAITWLKTLSTGALKYSRVYETPPVDCAPNTPNFLNAVCEISYNQDVLDLLRKMRDFERQRGRPIQYERNSPRPLDLDLLYADALVLNTPELILPHPRMLQRRFVLEPLADVHPDLVLPKTSKTIREFLASLPSTEDVKVSDYRLD